MKKVRRTLAYALALLMIVTGIPATGPVTVQAKKQVKAKSIKLSKTTYTLKKGKKVKLKATILPKKSTQKKVIWSTNKKKIATVSKSGVVKAKKNGTAIITAKIKGTSKKAKCKIIVGTPVSSVKLSDTSKQLEVGSKFQLKATVLPAKASVRSVSYQTSNKTIAEVTQSGVVTAKSAGSAVITVVSKDGTNKKAVCRIQVSNKQQSTTQTPVKDEPKEEPKDTTVKTTGISLNKQSLTFYSNSAPQQLEASVKPENATNKGVIWSSEDESIATVSDNGVVTPSKTKEGTTTITATAADKSGVKVTCEVKVIAGMQVTSAQQLREILNGSETYKLIHFQTDEKGEINIPEPDKKDKLKDTVLEIDAPNATITNYAQFKEVKIISISKDTYIEHADNTLIILAEDCHVVVKEDATIELQVNDEVKSLLIDNGGEIKNAVIKTSGKVTFEGKSSQASIPVTVDKNATIYTARRLNITANDKVLLTLKAGSEGTAVNTTNEKNAPEVKGLGTITVRIENNGKVDEKTVVADQTNEDVGAVTVSAVTGTVVDSDSKKLNDVKVFLAAYSKDFKIADFSERDAIKTATTNEDGVYKITSVKAGNYYLIFKKDGYYEAVQTCMLTNNTAEVTTASTVLTSKDVQVEKGSVSGKIIDSVTGNPVSGVTVRIREGQNNVTGEEAAKETTTNSEGIYKFTGLNPGIYTVQVLDLRSDNQKYISTSFNIYIESGKESENNGAGLSPIIDDEQVRFVLRWGNKESGAPSDLDSHMIGPKATGAGQFHTYYSDKTYVNDEDGETYADLDLDDTEWEGPETTTIYKGTPGVYYFFVHNFSDCEDTNSNTLATSQASVQVYSGSRLVQTFYMPNKEGTVWSVCSYDSLTGNITPSNEMSYESESEDVGSDVMYGDLKITNIQKNDFVKKATINGSRIKLRVASDDIKEHIKEIIPEIKLSGASYEVKYDESEEDWIIEISDGKGNQRTYRMQYSIDYGNKYITSFEENENVTDYSIYDDAVDLYMKHTDLSKKEVLQTIIPKFESSSVTYEIKYDEKLEGYVIELKDSDGSIRAYEIDVIWDTTDVSIKSMTSKDDRVQKIEVEDDYINIYGTAKNLDEIKDTFTYEFGPAVTKHSEIDINEDGDGTITLYSDDGEVQYYIYYYYDYGDFGIDGVESKDYDKIDLSDMSAVSISYNEIGIYAKNVGQDAKETIDKYLVFKFKKDTITGEVKKKDNGEYEYVITDSETKQSRRYKIRYEVYSYSDSYSVIDISGPENVLTDYDIGFSYIDLHGTANTIEDLLKQISFKYGENVESAEIETKEDDEDTDIYLVLKFKDGGTRKYLLHYYKED